MIEWAQRQNAYFAEVDAFQLDIEYVETIVNDEGEDSIVVVENSQQPPVEVGVTAPMVAKQDQENSAVVPKKKVVGRKARKNKDENTATITTSESSKTISTMDMSVLMHAMDESMAIIPSTPANEGRPQRESGMLTATKVNNLMAALDESVMVPSTPIGGGDGIPLQELMDAMNTTATQTTPAACSAKKDQTAGVVLMEPSTKQPQLSVAEFERLVSRLDESTEHVNVSVVHQDESAFFNVAEFDKLFRAVDAETSMRASVYDARVAQSGRKSSCLITERPEEQELLAVFKN